MSIQKTIAKEGTIEGIGLHTGKKTAVTLKPAADGDGITFYKEGRKLATLSASRKDTELCTGRCTSVKSGDDEILTVEHLLSALAGTGVTNAVIDVAGPEIPGLDGSAGEFVTFIRSLGIKDQNEPVETYAVDEPVFCHEGTAALAVYPAESFSIAYTLDYDHPRLKSQTVTFTMSPEAYAGEIAPARTFCTEMEAQVLQEKGFGLGCNRENTLVIMDDGSHEKAMRLEYECARHKVLDLVGDLAFLGFALKGRVVGVRSGHALNRRLVDAIKKQKEKTR